MRNIYNIQLPELRVLFEEFDRLKNEFIPPKNELMELAWRIPL